MRKVFKDIWMVNGRVDLLLIRIINYYKKEVFLIIYFGVEYRGVYRRSSLIENRFLYFGIFVFVVFDYRIFYLW